MRSLMRVSSVEIAASPLVVVPPTRKRRRTWEASTVAPAPPHVVVPVDLQRTRLGKPGRVGITVSRQPHFPRLSTCQDTSVSSLWTPSGEHQPPDGPPPGSDGDPPAPPDPSPE